MSQTSSESIPTEAGFFRALFDIRFTEWVTLRVAGVLYVVVIVLSGIGTLLFFRALAMTVDSILGMFLFVIGAPLGFFLQVLVWRLVFEAAIANIAIAKNTEALKK